MTGEPTETARWQLLADAGVMHERLRALEERLDADFTVANWGYEQLGDLGDERLRAVVSDQILRTCHAIGDNLISAVVHNQDLNDLVGRGRKLPKGDPAGVLRQGAKIDNAIGGFFGALASALDCLAAVAIGVVRLPRSISKADVRDLEPLRPKEQAAGTPTQQTAWADLAARYQQLSSVSPDGWLAWLMAMRNLLTHRARQQRIFLQETISPGDPQIAVVAATPKDVIDSWNFHPHLRRHPDLPDMQDFTRPGPPQNLWIGEPAVETLPLIRLLAAELINELCRDLLGYWDQTEQTPSDFPAPKDKWELGPEPGADFAGITGAPSSFKPDTSLAGNQLLKRLQLAERVLQSRRGSS